jgi:hypothetical protein
MPKNTPNPTLANDAGQPAIVSTVPIIMAFLPLFLTADTSGGLELAKGCSFGTEDESAVKFDWQCLHLIATDKISSPQKGQFFRDIL